MSTVCVNCGTPLSRPGAPFCGVCGHPQPGGRSPSTPPGGATVPDLLIQEPGKPDRTFPLKQRTAVGRAGTNDVIISNPAVSAEHLWIEQRGNDYWVVDRNSTNGTSLNGRPVQRARLNHDDIIRIGDIRGNTVALVFRHAATARVGPTHTVSLSSISPQAPRIILIGRDPSCTLHLDDPSISRRHAQVEQTTRGPVIRDLNSSNGTFLNGAPLRGTARALQEGDRVKIGPFELTYTQGELTDKHSPEVIYHLDAHALRRTVSIRKIGEPKTWLQPTKKVILNDISLSIHPKEFVALVGGSGAGKSTLMKALSGFEPASTGEVFVNGKDLYQEFAAYRSDLGYVPQEDIIHQLLTVRSALTYAARLRLPADATPQEVADRVNEALKQVELSEHADKQVKNLSGGQRKRVSIAVELLAKPGLFFLDEPTSGLDPGLEKKMMYDMRTLADEGRTIVLVTHATENIDQCTHVVFLAEGRLMFFGPPQEALDFFKAQGFAEIYLRLTQPLTDGQLPQTLRDKYQRIIHASDKEESAAIAQAWAEYFQQSPLYHQYVTNRRHSPAPSTRLAGAGSLPPSAQAASGHGAAQRARPKISFFRQFGILAQRYFELIRRDNVLLFILLAVMPLIGLLLLLMVNEHDLTGLQAGVSNEINMAITEERCSDEVLESLRETDKAFFTMEERVERCAEGRSDALDETFQGAYMVVGASQKLLFMMGLVATLLGIFAGAYEIVKERTIYYRERMINLKIGPYLLSKLTVLSLFAMVQLFLFMLIIGSKVRYPESGIVAPAAVEMYISLLLSTVAGISLGLFISAIVSSRNMVIYVVLLVLFVQILFAGAIFDLPAAAKPLSYLTSTRWTLEALGGTANMHELRERGVSCIEFESPPPSSPGTPPLRTSELDPCEPGQMRLQPTYNFNVTYFNLSETEAPGSATGEDERVGTGILDHGARRSHLLLRWFTLVGFVVLFMGLTYLAQRRKDRI